MNKTDQGDDKMYSRGQPLEVSDPSVVSIPKELTQIADRSNDLGLFHIAYSDFSMHTLAKFSM